MPARTTARRDRAVAVVRARARGCPAVPAPPARAHARHRRAHRTAPSGHALRRGRRRRRDRPGVAPGSDAGRHGARGVRRPGVRAARAAAPVRAPAAVGARAPGARPGGHRVHQRRDRRPALPRREHHQGPPLVGLLEARHPLPPGGERAGARSRCTTGDRPRAGLRRSPHDRKRGDAMMLYETSAAARAATHDGHTGRRFDRSLPPVLSVIVPTRDEAGNVATLLERLDTALPDFPVEIVFVDDSDDTTPAEVAEAGARCAREVGLIHRPAEARPDGLGGAVLEGLYAARGAWVCVMDGDLQHPPEVIADLLAEVDRTDADLVVASRRVPHGDADGLPWLRAAVSRFSTSAARRLFGRRLEDVSDPMSGFFVVRRSSLDLEQLHPHGFKILLEILVRTPDLRVREVPFHFGERHAGHSKATVAEGLRFLRLLWRLRVGDMVARFGKFGLVGATGLAVNTLALLAFTEGAGVYYVLSAILATQVSTIWNFTLTDLWVFRGGASRRTRMQRFLLFAVMNNAALLLRSPLLWLLTSALGIHYLVSNLLSLGVLTAIRYGVADVWIWARDPLGRETQTRNDYDIHGLVTVRS